MSNKEITMKTSEILAARLEKLFDKKIVKIERLYPGPGRRWSGHFIWAATFEDQTEAGSVFTMTACIKSPHLTWLGCGNGTETSFSESNMVLVDECPYCESHHIHRHGSSGDKKSADCWQGRGKFYILDITTGE